MAKVSVKVKFLKDKHDIEIMLDEPVELFKAQLYALTGVPNDRQKITAGAKQITDATDLKTVGLKDKQVLMLFGTAEEVLARPTETQTFIEDLAPEGMAAIMSAGVPFGLQNLGNTCYMNSTLQLLKNADEFSEAIVKAPSVADPLVKEAQNVFKQMDTTYEPIAPHPFWSRLKQRKPDFGQMTPQGGWMQHDAEECLTELLNCVNGVVKTNGKGLTDEHFRIEMDTVTTLAAGEGGSEEPTTKTDYTLKLSCHIQGNVKQADGSWKGGTDMMPQGIMNGLDGTIEKTSPSLGRMALYETKSRVTRLPKYVVTQLMRFFYKQDTQSKAKVKRPVKFPFALDMHDYCVPELQKKIYAYRERKGEAQRLEEAEAKKAKLSHNETPAAEAGAAAAGGDAKMEVEGEAPAAAIAVVEEDEQCFATYQLTGVLTHKGDSADGGHYVAWIRKDDGKWFLFDDDKVSEVKADRIKLLEGVSAMDHMAYLCLYKRTPLVFGSDNTRYEETKQPDAKATKKK
mmetsp:Transcript_56951/g.83558  ORF Transcript_56951/g.83558 Transcript_56951/m.83558 type:complete len:513 (-) Transcript_56951:587-2125(-)